MKEYVSYADWLWSGRVTRIPICDSFVEIRLIFRQFRSLGKEEGFLRNREARILLLCSSIEHSFTCSSADHRSCFENDQGEETFLLWLSSSDWFFRSLLVGGRSSSDFDALSREEFFRYLLARLDKNLRGEPMWNRYRASTDVHWFVHPFVFTGDNVTCLHNSSKISKWRSFSLPLSFFRHRAQRKKERMPLISCCVSAHSFGHRRRASRTIHEQHSSWRVYTRRVLIVC